MTVATGQPGAWQVCAPVPVGELTTLLRRLASTGEPVALGADFPLGVPRAYAELHAEACDFPSFLRSLADNPRFFDVCDSLDDITPGRPFYPMRGAAGMTRLSHAAALSFASAAELCRLCDQATAERPAGAPLFWTLGANQSGKAAISAWRDLLLPALSGASTLALWPFDGPLLSLLRPGRVVVAETYPAESMRHCGLRMDGSKRRQADRAALAIRLHEALRGLGGTPKPALQQALAEGFGSDAPGEDRFDSLLGLLGVLSVLGGRRPDTAPLDPWIQRWEGWVLGQTALPRHPTAVLSDIVTADEHIR